MDINYTKMLFKSTANSYSIPNTHHIIIFSYNSVGMKINKSQ